MGPLVCSLNSLDALPHGGGAQTYLLSFQAVQKNRKETPTESESTYSFSVRLQVSDSLLECGTWPDTSEDERQLQFFQYVQEELKSRAKPPGENETIVLKLMTYTYDNRFASGPVYDREHIHADRPFEIESTGRIGF